MKFAHRLAGIAACTLVVLGIATPAALASSLTVTSEDTTELGYIYVGLSGNADVAGRIWVYGFKDRTDCPADVNAVKGDLFSIIKDIDPGPISIPFQYGFGYGEPAAGRYLLCGYLTGEGTNASTPAAPVTVNVSPRPPGSMVAMVTYAGSSALLGQTNVYCFAFPKTDCPTTGTVSWRTDEAGRKALRVRSRLLASGPVKSCGEGTQCAIFGQALAPNVRRLERRTDGHRPITVKLTLTVHVTDPHEVTWTVPVTVRFRDGTVEDKGRETRCSTNDTDLWRCRKDGTPDRGYEKPPKYPPGPDSQPG